jgi:hypothetical protein
MKIVATSNTPSDIFHAKHTMGAICRDHWKDMALETTELYIYIRETNIIFLFIIIINLFFIFSRL